MGASMLTDADLDSPHVCDNSCAGGWHAAISGLSADCQSDDGHARVASDADALKLQNVASTQACAGECQKHGAVSYGWCGGSNCYGNCNCFFKFKSATQDHGQGHYPCVTC